MKLRNGFVSNSSASSFVVAKTLLTEEQSKAIRVFWAEKLGGSNSESDKLYEDYYYISFDLYHICEDFFDMCEKNGIKEEHINFYFNNCCNCDCRFF